MNYFNIVFTTFLCMDRGNSVAVYMQGQKALGYFKNIFICVLKINKGLTGLEHECE